MKIALILAASEKDPLIKLEPFMPLSLPLLAGSAPKNEYTFVNMLNKEKINYNEKYDLVGISYRISAEKTAYNISDAFRKKNIPVILGGPQPSSVPLEAIQHADCVVIGEGESLWPILLNDLKNKKLKNFYIASPVKFKAGKYSVFQINSFTDLKDIPQPKRDIYKKKYFFDTVFASRGCPIDCDFCSVPYLFGHKVRLRPVDHVINEIKNFKNYYYLLDDNVFGRSDNFDYYRELYEKISSFKNIKLWTGQANLDAAQSEKGKDVIKAAAKSGLVYVAIGMESINPVVLKKSGVIKKLGTKSEKDAIAKMKESIKFIQDQGIVVSGWFTIGYEEDTIDTYYKTLDFCLETKIMPVINALEALPGTRLFERLKKEKRITYDKNINIIHPKMKDEEIFEALNDIYKKGYSFSNILKRTMFSFFKFNSGKKMTFKNVYERIHKTIFSFVVDFKIKKGLIAFTNHESTSD